jgi:5-methylcytosine-specific restriction enzyme subunit McrC
MKNIPIKNIYYIVLYAWDKIQNKKTFDDKGKENINSISEVLLDIFLSEVERLIKKGILKEYIANKQISQFIKGKIKINETIRQRNKKIVSEFDDFSDNHFLNQQLKAFLITFNNMNTIFDKRLLNLLTKFDSVSMTKVDIRKLKNIKYNRLTSEYKFAMELGTMLLEKSIPSEDKQNMTFYKIFKDDEIMNDIFEKFIFNYYRIHFEYNVVRRKYIWDLTPINESDYRLIPTMNTDIEIETLNDKFIIDAKYYQSAFANNFGRKKFISGHMYQISSYMKKQNHSYKKLKGILMYPSNNYDFYEQFIDENNNILSFKTINLAKDWSEIRKDLDEIFI